MADFYCDEILSGLTPVVVVAETDRVLAFHHTRPYYEAHVVIIPKVHIDSISSVQDIEAELAKDFLDIIARITSMLELRFGGVVVYPVTWAPTNLQNTCTGTYMRVDELETKPETQFNLIKYSNEINLRAFGFGYASRPSWISIMLISGARNRYVA